MKISLVAASLLFFFLLPSVDAETFNRSGNDDDNGSLVMVQGTVIDSKTHATLPGSLKALRRILTDISKSVLLTGLSSDSSAWDTKRQR